MKIVHISPTYFDEWEYQENVIAKYHVKFGNDVYVISSRISFASYKKNYRWEKPKYKYNGINIIRLTPKYILIKELLYFADLKKTLDEIDPNIIMMHGGASLCLFDIVKYKRQHPSCKLVVDFHSDYFNSGRNAISKYVLHKIFWRYILKFSKQYFDRVYYITPSVKKFIKECYKFDDTELTPLYLGADFDNIDYESKSEIRRKIRNKYNISENDFVICTGGKIDKDKRIDLLLEAVKLCKKQDIKVIIFGTIEAEYYKNNIDSFEYQGLVNVGWLSKKEIIDIYFASDLVVFPGGQSVLWQQAICSGAPTIFKFNGYNDYLNLGGNCLFLFSETCWELKQLITILYNNRCVLVNMEEIAKSKAEEVFSYENISRGILIF